MDETKKDELIKLLKKNAIIVFYLLQLLFIFMYSEPEIQPFVYVRF